MRQVLLVPVPGSGKRRRAPDPLFPRRPKPLMLWMNDDAEIGDIFSWRGHVLQVSAIYGTRLSASAYIRPCEKPHKKPEQEVAIPLDR